MYSNGMKGCPTNRGDIFASVRFACDHQGAGLQVFILAEELLQPYVQICCHLHLICGDAPLPWTYEITVSGSPCDSS